MAKQSVNVYLAPYVAERLVAEAEAQGRKAPDLAAFFIEHQMMQQGLLPRAHEPAKEKVGRITLASLVSENLELLKSKAQISNSDLERIATGKKMEQNIENDLILLRIAMALDISEESIRIIAQSSIVNNE